MEVFELIVDNKVEVWRRDRVCIEAETIEEAINIAESGEYDYVDDAEYLTDTETYLAPTYGEMTCEVMDIHGKTLWSNENR